MEKSIIMKKAKWLSLIALLLQIVVYVISYYIRHHQASILSEFGTDVYTIGDYSYYIPGGTILILIAFLVAFVGMAIMKKPHIIFAVLFAVLVGLIYILHSYDFFSPHDYSLLFNYDFWTSYSRLKRCFDSYAGFPIVLSVAFFYMAIGMIIGGRYEFKNKVKGVSFKISAILMFIIILVKIVLNFNQKTIAAKVGILNLEEIKPWPVFGILDSTIPLCLLVIFVMTIIANRISKKEGLFAVLIAILTTIVVRAESLMSSFNYQILENCVSDREAFVITQVNYYIDKYTLWFFNISLILFFVGLGINYACSLKNSLNNKAAESVQ